MKPIHQVLNRIRWDDEFGKGIFEIGIYDRVEAVVKFQPLEALSMEPGNHFSFTVCVDDKEQAIPFHRIREVRKNGETIWQR